MGSPGQDKLESVLGRYRSESFTGYLPKSAMIHGGLYILCARYAYAGVWDAEQNRFFVARWKLGLGLGSEFHWDEEFIHEGAPFRAGTAKPMRQIGCMIESDRSTWIPFLIKLEMDNPIVPGVDTIAREFDVHKRWVDRCLSTCGKEFVYQEKPGNG